MPRYIALLRGINLGRRRIKMEDLRARFEQLPFAEVTTFIASGNVIFDSTSADPAQLEASIEHHLKNELGYEVDTFLRTTAELTAVAAHRPFAAPDMDDPAHTINVGFFKVAPTTDQSRRFAACRTDVDQISVKGREYYWLCRIKSSDSQIWKHPGMRGLKLPTSSMRNLNTVQKLAALYPPAAVRPR